MKLAHRLLLGSALVVVVLVVLIVVLTNARLGAQMQTLAVTELTHEARLIAAEWIPTVDPDALATTAGTALGHRVTLIDSTGHVVGDSRFHGAARERLENHAHRPEVMQAHRTGVGSSERVSPSAGDRELYVAVAAPLGTVRVSITTRQFDAVVARARRDVLLSGGVALVVALLLAAAFSRAVSRPIIELRDVARGLAHGDLSRRPALSAPGEVGELGDAVRDMADQLASRLAATRRLDAVRRDFVANVSHELKTPLTIIGGFAETLAADDLEPVQRVQFTDAIRANARRMQRIVDDLLDLTRIESGGWVPNPVHVDVASVATEATAPVRSVAHEKGVAIDTAVDPRAAVAVADPTAVRQIITNLVDNAVRHTNAGGTVTVFTEPDAHGIWLGVRDTGVGIAAEHLPRIFERFYRADPGRSRSAGGTGLGLAIVKHLAEAHGGSVRAESAVGVGTTIRVLLPAPAATAPGPRPGAGDILAR